MPWLREQRQGVRFQSVPLKLSSTLTDALKETCRHQRSVPKSRVSRAEHSISVTGCLVSESPAGSADLAETRSQSTLSLGLVTVSGASPWELPQRGSYAARHHQGRRRTCQKSARVKNRQNTSDDPKSNGVPHLHPDNGSCSSVYRRRHGVLDHRTH